MLTLADIKKLIDEAINPRINKDTTKSIDEIVVESIGNIDVKTDVEEVVNRRLNTDVTKSLNLYIADLINEIPKSSLKSVQVGHCYFSNGNTVFSGTIPVSISPVDPSKSMIIVQQNGHIGGSSITNGANGYIENNTTLQIGGGGGRSYVDTRWQVIEFY